MNPNRRPSNSFPGYNPNQAPPYPGQRSSFQQPPAFPGQMPNQSYQQPMNQQNMGFNRQFSNMPPQQQNMGFNRQFSNMPPQQQPNMGYNQQYSNMPPQQPNMGFNRQTSNMPPQQQGYPGQQRASFNQPMPQPYGGGPQNQGGPGQINNILNPNQKNNMRMFFTNIIGSTIYLYWLATVFWWEFAILEIRNEVFFNWFCKLILGLRVWLISTNNKRSFWETDFFEIRQERVGILGL